MRIDLYNAATSQIANDLNIQKAGGQCGSAVTNTFVGISAGDRASLSSGSTAVASLVSAALSSPEVRQSKVDSLRQAINSGQYQVDPARIASAMSAEIQ